MLTYEKRAGLSRLGYIFSGIAVTLFAIGVLAPISSVLTAVFSVFLFVAWGLAAFFSFGLLLLTPDFLDLPAKIMAFLENTGDWTGNFMLAAPYLFGISAALAAVSIASLSFEPSEKKHVGHIVCSSIVLALVVFVWLLALFGGNNGGAA